MNTRMKIMQRQLFLNTTHVSKRKSHINLLFYILNMFISKKVKFDIYPIGELWLN